MSAAAPGTTAFGAAGGRRKRPQKALCAPPRCAAPGSRCRTFRRRPQRCQPMRRCYNNPRTSCLLRRTGSSWGWSQTGRPACATSASWRSSCCGEPRACGHNVTPVPLGLKVSGIRPVRACEPVRARPFGHSPRASPAVRAFAPCEREVRVYTQCQAPTPCHPRQRQACPTGARARRAMAAAFSRGAGVY